MTTSSRQESNRSHPCDKSCRDAEHADRRPAGKIRLKVNNPPDKIKQAAQEEQQITGKYLPERDSNLDRLLDRVLRDIAGKNPHHFRKDSFHRGEE